MSTDILIAHLAAELRPVRPGRASIRLPAGLLGGSLAALAALLAAPALGVRGDLVHALGSAAFWIKLGYTALLAALGWIGLAALARPDGARPSWPRLLGLPVLGLAGITAGAWLAAPAGGASFWLGSSWSQCPVLIIAVALPIFAGLFIAMSSMAPTRLRSAGGAAGLVAGATAATIYQLHCTEFSPGFVFIWYSLGIAASAGLGALAGPRLLRW